MSDDTRSTNDDDLGTGPVGEPASTEDRYTLEEEIGRGGLGRLVRARDRRLGRVVALKLLRRMSTSIDRRFRREAELTARLQHPGIVPIYDFARWDGGEPFYVMKLISGSSLKQVLLDTPSRWDRLPLVGRVLAAAEAVAFAHSQSVIHRDLKPANIMLGEFGETLVIDWGLGKDLRQPDDPPSETAASSEPSATSTGEILGTPAYMAPEQARGEPVDRRADVYALGAVLYHVLAGRPPYEGASSDEVVRAVSTREPEPLRAAAAGSPAELLAITDKAMARDPARRYADAGELASDLKRFLDGQLVRAHAYTAWQRLRRFVRRNRLAVGVSTASLIALTVFGTYSVRRVVGARRVAEAALSRADRERAALRLSEATQWLDRDPTAAVAWLKAYANGPFSDPDRIGGVAAEALSRGAARQLVRGRMHATLAPDGRTLAAFVDANLVVWTIDRAAPRIVGALDRPSAVAFSPDSATVFTAEAGVVRAWTLSSGAVHTLHSGGEAIVALLAAPGVVAVAGERGSTWLLDPTGGGERRVEGHALGFSRLFASRDGAVLLSRAADLELRMWDVARGTAEPLAFRCKLPALSPSGSLAACGDASGVVHVYDRRTRRTRDLRGHTGAPQGLAFSADEKRLATASADHSVRVWNLSDGTAQVLEGHTDWTKQVAFSPDGRLLASSSLDRTVRLWDLASGVSLVLRGHKLPVVLLQLTPDSRALVTADLEGMVRVWPVVRPPDSAVRLDVGEAQVRFLHDGSLVVVDDAGRVHSWSASGGWRVLPGEGRGGPSAISPDQLSLVQAGESLLLRDLRSGARVRTLEGHKGAINEVSYSSDGKQLVSVGDDHTVRLWDLASATGRVLGTHDAATWHAAFSPDRKIIVSAGDDNDLRLWDLATGTVRLLVGHRDIVYSLRFAPDGRTLASAGLEATVRLWDLGGGTSRELVGHRGLVQMLAFSPDGATLASASDDETVRLWDVARGSSRTLQHGAGAAVVVFSADGRTLVTGAKDGTVRVWDVARGSERAAARSPTAISSLTFSPDERLVAAGTDDGRVLIWSGLLDAPLPPATATALDALGSVELVGDQALSP